MKPPSRLGAEALLVLATLIWGATFAVTRAGLAHVTPLLLIAIRFLGAFLVVGPLLALRGRAWWRRAGPGAVLGITLFASYALQTSGLQFTTAARSAFLTYLFAVLVPPLQRLFGRRRLTRANLAGLAVVVAGSTLMARPWQTSGWNAGDLMTLGAAACFALFIVLLDRYAQDSDPADFIPVQFAVAGLLAAVAALLFEPVAIDPVPGLLAAVIYLTLFATVGALGIQTIFQVYSTPVRASMIYALEPVFAAGFGLLLLGERMRPLEVAGAAVILGGVLFGELRVRPAR